MVSRTEFASKLGLIAATVGSAVGLGNVWRFPAETQANGGATFLLLYIVCTLLLGIPVMLGEFVLGRGGRSDAIGVFRKLSPGKKWWLAGAGGILASYLIVIFYMVVAGWTLEYLVGSLTGQFYTSWGLAPAGEDKTQYLATMTEMVTGVWPPILATAAVIAINIAILLRGVQKGIERLSNVLMPLLFVILLIMCAVSLTLPEAADGVAFFLKPDFSKVTPLAVMDALGQTFFSLSLGMGILITYASYYPITTNLPRTSLTVVLLSLMVALLMGLVIFPAVTSFGLQDESLEGATLIFVTLPQVFGHLPLSWLWSALFFILLLVAAITSTVSLSEVAIAFLCDTFGLSRRRAVLLALCPMFILSSICSLSMGPLNYVRLLGMNMFDLLDNFATNILLPLVAISTCIYLGWFAPKTLLREQLTNEGKLRSHLVKPVAFILRWVAPALILLILLGNL